MSSRESSPRRKKHRKHRHRRRSRSRSYSRSRSRSHDRKSKIHINPMFGYPHPSSSSSNSASTSSISATQQYYEHELTRLKNQLYNEQNNHQMSLQRMNLMTNELRNIGNAKMISDKRLMEMANEKRIIVDSQSEMRFRLKSLEETVQKMEKNQLESISKLEGKDEEIKNLVYQIDVTKQQNEGLNERNTELKGKCEVLVAKNREVQGEVETNRRNFEMAKMNVNRVDADLQLARIEIQRLMKEVENNKEKEDLWKKEKSALESKIWKKDDEIRQNTQKHQESLEKSQAQIEKLENRLKNEKPAYQQELTTEAIYQVIEKIKQNYGEQLEKMEEEVEKLKRRREEKEEGFGEIEELPDYLQTPMKPKPDVVLPPRGEFRPLRPSSGPPMDSPSQWQKYRNLEEGDNFGYRNRENPMDLTCIDAIYEEDDLLSGEEPIPIDNVEFIEKQIFGDD